MVKRYRVQLAEEEQQGLRSLVSKGRAAAYKQIHARILLLCDENQADGAMKDEEIARALKVGTATVERVRQRGVEEGTDPPESGGIIRRVPAEPQVVQDQQVRSQEGPEGAVHRVVHPGLGPWP